MEEKKKEIRISVRNLVEFILRSGDLDNSSGGFGERDAMQAGTRVHQQIQKKRGADYRAEVPLVHEKEYEHFILRVEGRADGMYEDGTTTVIEEIKGTYRDLETMEEPVPVHLAQAKCYAYIYGLQNRKEEMGVLMTYTLLSSEEEGLLRPLTKEEVKPEHSNWRIRHFLQTYKLPELEQWFGELLDAWFIWAEFQYQWQKARDASMQHLEFPFPYRKGQRELVSGVYRTILRKKELFVQAPTGIGKTMSTVFPAILIFLACSFHKYLQGLGRGLRRPSFLSDCENHHPYRGRGGGLHSKREGTAVQSNHADRKRKNVHPR